jgi:phosphate starvation-inducible membrane PsiE
MFIGTSISRLMIAAIINDVTNDIRYMVISAALIWLCIGAFVKNPKPRKILAPLHVLSSTAYLAFTFWLQYQTSGTNRSQFFLINAATALYPLLSQVLYFLLLVPGSTFLNLAVLETANIGFWWIFFSSASTVLYM